MHIETKNRTSLRGSEESEQSDIHIKTKQRAGVSGPLLSGMGHLFSGRENSSIVVLQIDGENIVDR